MDECNVPHNPRCSGARATSCLIESLGMRVRAADSPFAPPAIAVIAHPPATIQDIR